MSAFYNVKSYKDISKTTTNYAKARGLEVLVYHDEDEGQRFVEIWPLDDDQSELPFVRYLITDKGGLQFYSKFAEYHGVMIEDMLYTINTDKELRLVVNAVWYTVNVS